MNKIFELIAGNKLLVGIAVGVALAHVPKIIDLLFGLIVKVPAIKNWIAANHEKAKEIVAEAQQELDKDIDETKP